MNRSQIVVGVLLAMSVGAGYCDDSIRIRFESGECVLCSSEKSEIYVSRATYAGSNVVEIDKFFASIREALRRVDMPPSWSLVPAIHSDRVAVDISLDGIRYSLSAGYWGTRIAEQLEESEENRRRREALGKVLQQTAEYSSRRYLNRDR